MANEERFHYLDIEELAEYLCGLWEQDYDRPELDERLMEKYALDTDHFAYLLKDLSPLLRMGISPITEKASIGFTTNDTSGKNKVKVWLAKIPFHGFINQVLTWMDSSKITNGEATGFERIITKEGKPEFKLVLMKADAQFTIKNTDRKEVSNG